MSKSIHTIDSRENLELLTVAAFFGIQSDAMHSLISDWHDLLEAELQSEGIDYRELKAALVPAKKKREAALIFDTAAIPDAWYPLPVFEKLLQYLDRKSVNSVLMGDFIERSSPGYLQRCLEEAAGLTRTGRTTISSFISTTSRKATRRISTGISGSSPVTGVLRTCRTVPYSRRCSARC